MMVGMNKKPFHILRLKKALTRHNASITKPHPTPQDSTTMPTSQDTTPASSSASTFSGQSLISLPWQLQSSKSPPIEHHLDECPLGTNLDISKPALTQGPSKAFLEAMEACGHNHPPEKDVLRSSPSLPVTSCMEHSSGGFRKGGGSGGGSGSVERGKTVFLPSYLKEDSLERSFSELVDEHTPIQKALCSPPFLPNMWDPERKELVRKYSCIYGKNVNRRQKGLLSPFEEQVNEGAYQLCLRDPTLLIRREELFSLAKRALKEGGYYSHGYSKGKDLESTIATTGQKRSREEERDGGEQNHSRVLSIPTSKNMTSATDDLPKKLSGRMRQEKMIDLERLIASNKAQQAAKLVELEKAQQHGHFSSAFSIQLEVEALGTACQHLQSSLAALKRKQRRSERYYTLKAREGVRMDGDQLSDLPEGRTRRDTSSHFQEPGISDDDDPGPGALEKYELESKKVKITHSPVTGRPTVTARVIQKIRSSTPITQPQGGMGAATCNSPESNDQEVRDLVKNVSNATDEVNSLMIREFQKQLEWDL